MRLLICRHGQSLSNLAWSKAEFYGDADAPLSELGQQQAAQLAEAFADGSLPKPDHLISSLMTRAIMTAAPISEALDQPVICWDDVHEVGGMYGRWPEDPELRIANTGATRESLLALTPRLLLPDVATEAGWYFADVETREEAWQRAQRVIAKLTSQFADDELVVLISHGFFFQLLLRAALGCKPDLSITVLDAWFDIYNTATAYLSMPNEYGNPACIHWVNRTSHLRDDQLTT